MCGEKKLPNIPIVRIAVPNWTACIVISAGNTPWISSSPSGNTSFNTSRMFISLIARYGLRYTIFLPVPVFLTREFNAGKINSYVHPLRLFMFLSCLFFLFFFALIPSSLDGINWSVEGEVGESAEISAEDVVLQMDLSKDVIDFWYDDLNEKERRKNVKQP